MNIRNRLFELADETYAAFQSGLVPTIGRDRFIGVRVPALRMLAKEIVKEQEQEDFLNALPHDYYDEDVLHALLLSEMTEFDACIERLEYFLPFVDNWAVCDIMSPKCFRKNKNRLLEKIRKWTASERVYTCRFGMEMLMTHFLDADFEAAYLDIPAGVTLDDYYVRMMVAWFFATALAKQWEAAIPYLEGKHLNPWTHAKTIQKARESFRIPEERKAYLKSLKG